MGSIAIVGAGFAGMSAAARLAKLGHDVTIYDAASVAGGRLNGIDIDGKIWRTSAMTVTLPGVFRDLFRKSGRPMSALIGLEPAEPRRHIHFGARGKTELDLPTGTRSAQHDAIMGAFGRDPWSPWLDGLVDEWDTLRRFVYEQVTTDEDIRAIESRISVRQSAQSSVRKALRHRQLESMATDRWRFSGINPRLTPAAWNVWHYVERNFGRWRFEGDMDGLSAAMIKRLSERKVTMNLNSHVLGVTMKLGRVVGIQTDHEVVEADHVVWASGHTLPGLLGPSHDNSNAVYTGIELEGYSLPRSLMVHGKHCMHAWDSGPNRWVSVTLKGTDVSRLLKRIGIPKEALVSLTTFETPQQQSHEAMTIGSGLGLELQSKMRGPKNERAKLIARPATSPAVGLYLVGGSALGGSNLELTGLGTAAVAAAIGPAPRNVASADA